MTTTPPALRPTCPGWPTLPQWACAFVPFGMGLVVALWAAEVTPNLRLYRSIYTVWLAQVLVIPALAVFPHLDGHLSRFQVWRLFWTFSYLAYLVHLGYAWYGIFGGQMALATAHPALYHVRANPTILDLVVVHQGRIVAYSNLGVTILWGLDVVLAWLLPGSRSGPLGRVLTLERVLAWLWVLASFLVASIYFPKHTISVALGWLLVATTILSVLLRLILRRPAKAAGPDAR